MSYLDIVKAKRLEAAQKTARDFELKQSREILMGLQQIDRSVKASGEQLAPLLKNLAKTIDSTEG